MRVNAARVVKPATAVGPGDVLTFPQGARIRVVRITGLGVRRGPAAEAQTLYEDLTPERADAIPAERSGPRPTKRDRRALDALRDGEGPEN